MRCGFISQTSKRKGRERLQGLKEKTRNRDDWGKDKRWPWSRRQKLAIRVAFKLFKIVFMEETSKEFERSVRKETFGIKVAVHLAISAVKRVPRC